MSAPVLFGELGVVAIQSLTRLRQRRELKIAQMSIIDESPHQQRAHLVPCLHLHCSRQRLYLTACCAVFLFSSLCGPCHELRHDKGCAYLLGWVQGGGYGGYDEWGGGGGYGGYEEGYGQDAYMGYGGGYEDYNGGGYDSSYGGVAGASGMAMVPMMLPNGQVSCSLPSPSYLLVHTFKSSRQAHGMHSGRGMEGERRTASQRAP